MDNAQSPDDILKQNARSQAFNNGYTEARHRAAGVNSTQLRARCTEFVGTGQFYSGWMTFCDELEAAEKAFAKSDVLYKRRVLKDRLAAALTWILFAAALALAGLYSWSYYLRQADRAAEEHRLADLAGRVQWLGNMTTCRYWPSDHDPRGNLLVMENRQIEIGLKPDGTLVWRKLPAGKQGK